MKSSIGIRGLIVIAAIVGLVGTAYAFSGRMMGGGGYGHGYGYGMMGNGNGSGYGNGYGMRGGYGYGYGMMNQGLGYAGPMENNGYGNLSKDDAARLQHSRDKFEKATRGLRKDILVKQHALQQEMAKADPDPGKVSRMQRELSGLQSQYQRKAMDFQRETRNLRPQGQGGQGYASGSGSCGW
jgi:hypothetical protein